MIVIEEKCGWGSANLKNYFTVQAAINYSLLESYLYSLISLPGRCELNCSWSLIAALFHKLTFLPSITDPVQDKSVKTDLVQFTNKIKVWSGYSFSLLCLPSYFETFFCNLYNKVSWIVKY